MQSDGVMLINSVDLIQDENIGNIEYDRFKLRGLRCMGNKFGISLSPQKSTLSEVSEARQMLCLVSAMPLLTAHY